MVEDFSAFDTGLSSIIGKSPNLGIYYYWNLTLDYGRHVQNIPIRQRHPGPGMGPSLRSATLWGGGIFPPKFRTNPSKYEIAC